MRAHVAYRKRSDVAKMNDELIAHGGGRQLVEAPVRLSQSQASYDVLGNLSKYCVV